MTKKLKQIFMPLAIAFLLLTVLVTPAFASEVNSDNVLDGQIYYTEDSLEAGVVHEYQNGNNAVQSRIRNIIKVAARDSGKDKVIVYAQNIGVDTFDKVACYVRVYSKNSNNALVLQHGKTHTFTNISPVVIQKDTIAVPNWQLVEVTNIKCMDGSDYGTLPSFSLSKK